MNAVLFNVKGNVVAGVMGRFSAGRGAPSDHPPHGAVSLVGEVVWW